MIKPLNKYILVAVKTEEKKTASGIYFVDTHSSEVTKQGEVISVGKDVEEIQVGNTVIFPKECGVTVKEEDKEYLVLNQSNVLAIKYSNTVMIR